MVWPYVAHTRPATWPTTFILALTGVAVSPARGSGIELIVTLGTLFAVHSVLLWGGTNAFNTGEDGEGGALNLLKNPPPIPRQLSAFGLALKAVATTWALLVDARAGFLVGAASVLSVLYSHKRRFKHWAPRRAKDIGGADVLLYAVGCGWGAILLGYTLTGAELNVEVFVVGAVFSLAVFAGCPTSQIFQLRPEDTYATCPNWSTRLGVRRVLRWGAVCIGGHALLLALLPLWFASLRPASVWAMALVVAAVGLALVAAAHSAWWSASPYRNAYGRMTRQMSLLLGAQLLWTLSVW